MMFNKNLAMFNKNSSVFNKNYTFSHIALNILLSFFLLLQLFPPLWVQDVTSLRHFLVALFDISALAVIVIGVFKQKISVANPLRFKPILVFLFLIAFMGISMIWAMNRVESIAVWNRWILIFASSCLMGLMLTNSPKTFHVLVYCTIVITFVNVLTCIIGYYYFDLHISQRRNLMLNGGYGNKNIFAVCLLVKLPLLYYAIFRYKRVWKIISFVLVFGVCFSLVILSARSTFIGLMLQMIVLFGYLLFQSFRFKASKKYLITIAAVFLVAFVGFFSGNRFISYNYNKYASHSVKNNYTIAARVKTIEEGNSKGRLLIWEHTIDIIKKSPWIGYGVGNHKLAIMQVEAAAKTNYVVSDHAHNDFLEMQSELGVLGELFYVLLYLSMFIVGIKIMYSKKTKEQYRLIALCSMLLLITYMNDALFNFPNERASNQIYLALSVAMMFFVYNKTKNDIRFMKRPKTVLVAASVVMVLCLYVESCHFISSIEQHRRIICYNSRNKNHIPPSYWVNVMPWLPNIDESTKPIAINNAAMFALQGDYRSAVNIVLADNSNPYYGLKEYRLASYYAHLDMIDSSNYWADKCIAMKPLCYDPVSVKVGNCIKQNDKQGQIRLITDYLSKEKKEQRAWIKLIDIYLEDGDIESAEKVFQQFCLYNDQNKEILSKKKEIDAIKQQK